MISEILIPSGGGNFYDESQSPENNAGMSINEIYPSPYYSENSGLYSTFFSSNIVAASAVEKSSIIAPSGFFSIFSNALEAGSNQISDFNIFNPYIHYYPNNSSTITNKNKSQNFSVKIPYVSDYEIASPFYPY